jgi:hypothetical protein
MKKCVKEGKGVAAFVGHFKGMIVAGRKFFLTRAGIESIVYQNSID